MRLVILYMLLAAAAGAATPSCADRDHLKAGECYRAASDWKHAEAAFRAAVQADRNSIPAAVAHAQSMLSLNQPFDALVELEDFLKRQPDAMPAVKLYAALCDTVLADHAKAKEVLESAAASAPRDAEVWTALGSHYLDLNDPQHALGSFQRAYELDARNPLILGSLAYSYSELDDDQHASAMFAEALRSPEPPNAAVYLVYGKYLVKSGKLAEAQRALTRALELDPHLSQAYYERSLLYAKLDKPDAAIADAQSALKESPERIDAHMVLQRMYRRQGLQAKLAAETQSIVDATSAAQERQALGRALREQLNIAEPLLAAQKFSEAIPHYEEIVRLLPRFYEAWFALGISYAQTNQPAKAEASFQHYLEFQPLSSDGHAALGFLYQQLNRKAEARSQFEEALRLDPTLDEVKVGLANL